MDTDLQLTPPFWVTSDSHFCHKNISVYQNRPPNVDELMVERWNAVVPADGTVLHLGDLHLGKKEDIPRFTDRLNGKRKLLVRGNHDRTGPKGREWYAELGFTVMDGPLTWAYGDWMVTFSHVPDLRFIQYPRHLNVHGHVHRASKSDQRFVNVSVEVTNYKPVEISTLLDIRIAALGQAQSRRRVR